MSKAITQAVLRPSGVELATVTVHIPFQFKRRGGRKLIYGADGTPLELTVSAAPAVDDTLVKTLVKAHRWRRRIETGKAKSITDLAAQEGISDAYVQRLLTLTCLAPDITAAILDGRQPKGLTATEMLRDVPPAWAEQRAKWGFQPA
ncbi:MAG: hypothetical protein GC191_21005 [Azospirillum sp.]|nr:hypothetical protein [Azospirillum sp.]